MGQMFWCAWILLLINTTAYSQTSPKNSGVKQQPASKKLQTNNRVQKNPVSSRGKASLSSTGSYSAKQSLVNASPVTRFTIGDTILKTLDARANGADIRFNKSGIVGMPKRAYGFADGRLLLRSTGATTFGTQTGSGAVGTGTSLGTFGSNGPAMSVNGKSPYAGINMWGNARNMDIVRSDSAVRLTPLKKQ